jgi:hypothetical protein
VGGWAGKQQSDGTGILPGYTPSGPLQDALSLVDIVQPTLPVRPGTVDAAAQECRIDATERPQEFLKYFVTVTQEACRTVDVVGHHD